MNSLKKLYNDIPYIQIMQLKMYIYATRMHRNMLFLKRRVFKMIKIFGTAA